MLVCCIHCFVALMIWKVACASDWGIQLGSSLRPYLGLGRSHFTSLCLSFHSCLVFILSQRLQILQALRFLSFKFMQRLTQWSSDLTVFKHYCNTNDAYDYAGNTVLLCRITPLNMPIFIPKQKAQLNASCYKSYANYNCNLNSFYFSFIQIVQDINFVLMLCDCYCSARGSFIHLLCSKCIISIKYWKAKNIEFA